MTRVPSEAPTDRQAEILRFLRGYYVEHGIPPTYREMQAAFGFPHVSGAQCHLRALEAKGLIRRPPAIEGQRQRCMLPAGYCVVEAAELERLRKAAGESGA